MTRIKGQATTADYLPFEEFQKLLKGLHEDKLYRWEAYCKISFCTAFRVSDVRSTKWQDILNKTEFIKQEQKTQKKRVVKFNNEIRENIKQMYNIIGRPDPRLSVINNVKTKEPYSREHINYMLKIFLSTYELKIQHFSSHTFRKTFARTSFEANGSSMEALFHIQHILNHESPQTTLAYMGYVQDDINKIYNSLHF